MKFLDFLSDFVLTNKRSAHTSGNVAGSVLQRVTILSLQHVALNLAALNWCDIKQEQNDLSFQSRIICTALANHRSFDMRLMRPRRRLAVLCCGILCPKMSEKLNQQINHLFESSDSHSAVL